MGGSTLDTSIVPNLWPMNLDPAMDPSAAATTGASAPAQQTSTAPAQTTQNGFGNVFMGTS